MTDFYAEAKELFEYTSFLRRDFHRHPELGFQEVRTAGVVSRELNALGLEVTPGVAKTGVVALLEGAKPGPVVMVRFDMDALPILEETGTEYASQNPGVMHACGHDAHTSIGLTVAKLLSEHRDELAGTVKFVFQPAEEGLGGAEVMIAEGALENPRPDVALGMHVWNEKPVGWVGASPGPVMAAGEIFNIKVHGRGGHGAAPYLAIDPVAASAQIISALQTIVSRNVPPLKTAVVSVTTVHGGEAFNIIPSLVEMTGTVRTFESEIRERILERFDEIVHGVAEAMDCQVEIDMKLLTPAVENHPQVTGRVQEVAKRVLPRVDLSTDYQTMGSEDMAYFLQKVPGCFVFVGSANADKGLNAPHHHPRFDIDESVLAEGVGLMAATVVDLLNNPLS